jgi:hypothetical protein
VCSSLELVLDHSALIPCGDKPEEEKQAIRRLGDILPSTNATWYVTREYLRQAQSILERAERASSVTKATELPTESFTRASRISTK